MTDSFPRQQARTRGFTLGAPRSFEISPGGDRVAFLRSQGPDDPVTCLWVLDVSTGTERLIVNPAELATPATGLTDLERALRERLRESAAGVTSFATDTDLTVAAFALGGQVFVAGLTAADHEVRRIGAQVPAFDPRPDPRGRRVAYVTGGALRVIDLETGEDREIAGPAGQPGVTYGLAEFIAAEEMHRMRGYWWGPSGEALLVARVDDTPVNRWYIADPANPDRQPAQVAYPSAGTPNADVSLLLATLDGATTEVEWDRATFCYLVTAHWDSHGPLIVVQTRDQRRMRLLAADPATGATTVIREDTDERWVDIVTGVPGRTSDGRIVWTTDAGGAKRLLVAPEADLAGPDVAPVTPADLHLRRVLSVDGETVLFNATRGKSAQIGMWCYGPGGLAEIAQGSGLVTGLRAGGTTVAVRSSLAEPATTVTVLRDDGSEAATITSLAGQPSLPAPAPDLFEAGDRGIRTALLLPSWHEPGSAKLPVLLDPYGGPHGQRVIAAQSAFWASQWFAEQGFAVIVADGRGTPGGYEWERAVAGDLAGPVLDDQIEALHAAADRCGDLDTSRVAIRGWSFGGYLSALAVLRRPDVFHAALVGAPVTDQRLYDTHYTERYLGDPATSQAAYDNCSPVKDAERLAGRDDVTARPMMIIHGLADDNVVVAHSLRLSSALLAAGYQHSVLPLTGVTHLASREDVAENMLLLQVDFLRQALGM